MLHSVELKIAETRAMGSKQSIFLAVSYNELPAIATETEARKGITMDTYKPGDTCTGSIWMTLTKKQAVKSVAIKLVNRTLVVNRFVDKDTGNPSFRTKVVDESPPEEVMKQSVDKVLEKGVYEYPFEFTIPATAPSTFAYQDSQSSPGKTGSGLSAFAGGLFLEVQLNNQIQMAPVVVTSKPTVEEGDKHAIETTAGDVEVKFSSTQTAFSAGKKANFEVEIQNNGKSPIGKIGFRYLSKWRDPKIDPNNCLRFCLFAFRDLLQGKKSEKLHEMDVNVDVGETKTIPVEFPIETYLGTYQSELLVVENFVVAEIHYENKRKPFAKAQLPVDIRGVGGHVFDFNKGFVKVSGSAAYVLGQKELEKEQDSGWDTFRKMYDLTSTAWDVFSLVEAFIG